MSQPGLYVVATPIGNLEDITFRAVRLLSEADLIAAEDTRHSSKLLKHYDISTPMFAFHEHNEAQIENQILDRLANGETIALISDAGTPLISDPGYRLVCSARQAGLAVYSIPGASALTAALSVAGLPPDRFSFEGFLSSKAVARKKKLEELHYESRTLVFFESSHRILAAIKDISEVFGPMRLVAVCRELTKKFETVIRAPAAELHELLARDKNQTKGEFVIVVDGYKGDEDKALSDAYQMALALTEYLPASQAARVAAKMNGVSRRKVYQLMKPENR